MEALLLAGQAQAVEGEPEGLRATTEAALLSQLFQRRVGLIPDQPGQPLQVVRSEGRRRAPAVRFGVERPRGAAALEQSDDERGADAKDAGDPADRAIVMIDRRRDPLAKIRGIGAHGCDLLTTFLHPRGTHLGNYSRVQHDGKPL